MRTSISLVAFFPLSTGMAISSANARQKIYVVYGFYKLCWFPVFLIFNSFSHSLRIVAWTKLKGSGDSHACILCVLGFDQELEVLPMNYPLDVVSWSVVVCWVPVTLDVFCIMRSAFLKSTYSFTIYLFVQLGLEEGECRARSHCSPDHPLKTSRMITAIPIFILLYTFFLRL